SEAARLMAADLAWQRRGAVRDAVVACHRGDALLGLAAAEIALHGQVVEIFERRRALGEANLTEVNLARRGADSAHRSQAALRAAAEACRGDLASALSLPLAAVRDLALDYDGMMPAEAVAIPSAGMRRAALLGTLAIRQALAGYAAAEAALRLAVARQYPDITITPGLFWDQGGLLWALGGGLTAALLHNNEGPIAEAEAARHAAAQAVLAVQGRIIAALADADARLAAARVELAAAGALLERRRERLAVAERRLEGGDVGRLEVTEAQLAVREAESTVLATRLDLIAVQAIYEDAVGLPLIGRGSPALDLEAMALREPGWNRGTP
ncbi:MAG: TolC family protein, partial [Alphaproteobacteria bacterium]|nr:TolC family protein [Alphaproteobacteria bacterium]